MSNQHTMDTQRDPQDPQRTTSDVAAIEAVTIAAFHDAEHTSHTEHLLLNALRHAGQPTLSLVADDDERWSAMWRSRRYGLHWPYWIGSAWGRCRSAAAAEAGDRRATMNHAIAATGVRWARRAACSWEIRTTTNALVLGRERTGAALDAA